MSFPCPINYLWNQNHTSHYTFDELFSSQTCPNNSPETTWRQLNNTVQGKHLKYTYVCRMSINIDTETLLSRAIKHNAVKFEISTYLAEITNLSQCDFMSSSSGCSTMYRPSNSNLLAISFSRLNMANGTFKW